MVDRTPKYFFFLYVLVTTNVNSAVDHCIPFSVSKNAFLSKVAGVTNRGTFFLEDPVVLLHISMLKNIIAGCLVFSTRCWKNTVSEINAVLHVFGLL